ncbi:hypothetical protein CO174_05300 [Candidatus Uhrbacteria bacterium CG_4_9_14_3_um_filter_50_9]|uniref:Transcriptional repressor n=1 Tax=Candidatus Uhrbacteria bacterium CG_4_9_14_3_um_filter_50_9 TaxID=1975035 RepID=A0A2M7XB00_9BACT|nr:MAG: hypothetical protein CO174_05300 [Candidatus Uhrbacteria bacterium CG_4_9_14_3_um_filter_50_9]
MTQEEMKTKLRDAGFRATNTRMAVLSYLDSQHKPVGIEKIAERLSDTNLTTLYRMMNDFENARIVHAHELGHGHQDYELADRPHHHHIVCEECGDIEDVYACKDDCEFEEKTLRSSSKFTTINRQTTTFFGTCKQCS